MIEKKCLNCGDDGMGQVTVCIACPTCEGNGLNELEELRSLADSLEKNLSGRRRPHKEAVAHLKRIRQSQGDKNWKLHK